MRAAFVAFVARLLSVVLAGVVLWQALEREMEWLAVTSLIALLATVLPGFLADLVNRLRPFELGSFKAGPRRVADGPAGGRLAKVQETIDQRIKELQKDPRFIFMPSPLREAHLDLEALTVRIEAIEKELLDQRQAS